MSFPAMFDLYQEPGTAEEKKHLFENIPVLIIGQQINIKERVVL